MTQHTRAPARRAPHPPAGGQPALRFALLRAALLGLVFLVSALGAHAACDPSVSCCASSGTGSPCGGAGVATQGNDSGTNSGAGNPIHLISGNKFQREVDMPALPGVLGLELIRYYNSADTERHLLGRGWRLSYETTLHARAGSLLIVQADGTRIRFGQTALQPDTYRARTPLQGLVKALPTQRGTEYLWRWADGRELRFSTAGQLEQIRAPSGEFVSLRHDHRGWLVEVIDPAGRRLRLNLPDKAAARSGERFRGVHSIDTPVGTYRYEYGGPLPAGSAADQGAVIANLVKVSYPLPDRAASVADPPLADGASPPAHGRLYHHEDPRFPTLLTGISAIGPGADGQVGVQRLVTWAYDAQRRAVLSLKGERPSSGAGLEQVSLQWLPEENGQGKTLLSNSLGQVTVYTSATIAGEARILEVRGAGCASCGPSNVRYGYDRLGRLIEETVLDAQGRPLRRTRTQLDGYGRPVQRSAIAYRDGRPQPARWLVRYEYATVDERDPDALPSPQPVLIATPSVIPGKERIVRIAYNAAQQPITVSEEGWSPVDEQGRPSPQGTPIRRSTHYGYATINGRSVLASIDGPLPNGALNSPEDSDVSRYEWDARGDFVTALTAPGDGTTRLGVNPDTGRITQTVRPNGITEVYAHDPAGREVLRVRRRGDVELLRQSVRYDASGQPIESLRRVGGRDAPQQRQAFDTAGRLLWQADALGVLRLARYDTEGHLLASRVTGAGIDQEERYDRDAHGRLLSVRDNTGGQRRLVRDALGRLIATVDPLGRWTRYEREAGGLRVVQAANTGKPLVLRVEPDGRGRWRTLSAEAHDGLRVSRRVTHRRLIDDFGREVLVDNPDSGREVRRFDAADRLVQALQADGSRVDFTHDLRGRPVRRSVTPAPGAAGVLAQTAHTVRYLYPGSDLVGIEAPEQSERYTHDDHGRIASKTVTLSLNNGTPVHSTTRYRYDAEGRLAAQSLPDGSELQYERDGQGQIVALHHQRGPWAPFGWGRTTLARDLRRDLVGLAHIRYGNGIEGRWQRSREGVLARVVYTVAPREPSAWRTALERLMSGAHAQAADTANTATSNAVTSNTVAANTVSSGTAPAPSAPVPGAPGAFGLPADPQTLWDSRLLFDAAGNVLVQRQWADSAAARPGQMVLSYDAQDQLVQALRTDSPGPALRTSAPRSPAAAWRYHHDSLGNRLLAQQPAVTRNTAATDRLGYASDSNRGLAPVLDPAGRPLQDGARRYEWDSLGRLASLTQGAETTRYRYNRLGLRIAKQGRVQQHYLYNEQRQRIAELDANGRLTREYVWLGDQLLAVIDAPRAQALRAPAQGLFESLGRAVQLAWNGLTEPAATVSYVHANHLGAPVLATDEQGQPVWAANYTPFGQRLESAADLVKTATGAAPSLGRRSLRLDLRLPGQWEDEESGLHYNDQRYYDPQAGRYVSPDPLGLAGGLNAYAYVGNNPMGFVDPLGLVLFAFDGTDNTNDEEWLRARGSSLTNVWQFRQLYQDGTARYITGVGTLHRDAQHGDIEPPWLDNAFNYSGASRIDRMLQYFNAEADSATDDDLAMEVDIVGFSRGASQARDFANQIVAATRDGLYRYTVTKSDGTQERRCQKVNLRFMGLFDTVLSTNYSGHTYNLGIPSEFAHVAHAVALNEYRGDTFHPYGSIGAFPLESILPNMASPVPVAGQARIERGFIGAHADIGGGFGENDSQLAQVALIWMVQQAEAAGVKMQQPPTTIVASPLIHDKSDSIQTGAPAEAVEDRQVRYREGTRTTQRQMPFTAGMSWTDTQSFIRYLPVDDPQRRQFVTGTIDMQSYLDWLNANGYAIDLKVQGL